jgi:hypothetical protein
LAPNKIPLRFYRTKGGGEPVREWLKALDSDDRTAIGQDLMRVQFRWPVGMPLCRKLGEGLWELRTDPARQSDRAGDLFLPPRSSGRLARLPEEDTKDPGRGHRPRRQAPQGGGAVRKNSHIGSTLDDFLAEEGVLELFQAQAIKEVIAWQLAQAMKKKRISKKRLAELMRTSRTQVDRLLNPTDGNVTIETLQRAASIVGHKLPLELV